MYNMEVFSHRILTYCSMKVNLCLAFFFSFTFCDAALLLDQFEIWLQMSGFNYSSDKA